MNASQREVVTYDFLAGGGEMGELMRALDWSATPLGSPSTWPQSLRTAVSICLNSRSSILLWWGPQLVELYNDAYRPVLGQTKHPDALGAPGREIWLEIWDIIAPMLQSVMQRGEATLRTDQQLFLDRKGFLEECYFTYAYSPIREESGAIGGVFSTVVETTARVVGERRLRTLRDLAARSAGAESVVQVCQRQESVLAQNPNDLPFTGLYLFDAARRSVEIGWRTGTIPLEMTPERALVAELAKYWPLADVEVSGRAMIIEDFRTPSGDVPASLWLDPVRRVLVLPVRGAGVTPLIGFFIVGISPRLILDDEYRGFLDLAASQIAAALSDARAYEAERKRAEALLEHDSAKTAFLSNVSHEFRTPLTLILGPLADTLSRNQLPAADRESVEVAHRNSLRLLKLVNTLLDFSRIEAGRTQARYEPTDLAGLTRDLSSLFRSTIERADLTFEVACDELPQPVYVDREMWEKIVLNLLSNAFKFTLSGAIRVALTSDPKAAILTVSDTGVGIPAEELPRLFDRFHRIEGMPGRTHEGSGIGLALVQELAKLHGASIAVASAVSEGSTFTVKIPFGMSHLPEGRVRTEPRTSAPMIGGQAFIQEALRWLPDATGERMRAEDSELAEIDRRFASTFGARIILADDNADMRAYVRELLAPFYEVEAVVDGAQALEAARRVRPGLILSDVMMPNVGGFSLLKAIRTEPGLQGIPVILLSARAGEESRVEGLDAGADDYLVKPFAARELLARVGALIELTQLRQVGEERLRLAIEGARMSTWDTDLETGRSHWSATHFELLGYEPRRDGIGNLALWRERLHPDDAEHVDALLGEAATQRTMYQTEHRIIRADTDEVRWVSVYGRFLGDGPGPARRSVGIMLDVTDRKRAEEALRTADRRKDEFLAILAHELRNPLAPVRNAARILGAEHLEPKQLAWCREVIQRQVRQMALLLDDLLDVSRITLGRLQLKKELVEVATFVESAIEAARPLIETRRHRLTLEVPDTPVLLEVDPLRMAQVVANLLTNAAKYMDPGGDISLSVRSIDQAVELMVADTGIGLCAEDLERVFTMFSQVDSAIDRSQGGLGIGLALVKGIVELHGGTVRAQSHGPGHGCQFTVQLPAFLLNETAREKATSTTPRVRAARRILVADDNRDAAESLAMLFELSGHEVRMANNGMDALGIIEDFQPDVAFIDIGMPQLNGYEVARRLRREPWGAGVRLVALTGWGQDDNKRQAKLSGFDHHITKPVDPDHLESLLDRLLQSPP